MTIIHGDSRADASQLEQNTASETARGIRELSPQEIIAVAGGPEGSVGSGLNPP